MSTGADNQPKSWADMSADEKSERARDLTVRWLEQARDESPLTVLTGAAAIIMVLLKNAPEDTRGFLSLLLQDLFEGNTDGTDIDLDGVLLN
jgi:hypothetical protein